MFLLAVNEASRLGYPRIEPEHVLLGLARAKGEVAQELFNAGLPLERLRLLVGTGEESGANEVPRYSEATRQLVRLAGGVAKTNTITPADLLRAVLRQPESRAYSILKHSGSWERLTVFLG